MGCCGCTNKTSVVTGGILALIQSGLGLISNIYFLALYFGYEGIPPFRTFGSDQEILLEVTSSQFPLIRGLLVTATVLHIAWLFSSIAVLVGNSRDNANSLRQWIVITVLIIIGDVLFPVLFLVYTIPLIVKVHVVLHDLLSIQRERPESTTSNYEITFALWKYYTILLFSFCKFGLVSLVTNICLCAFTNRRVYELTKQNTENAPTTVPVPYGPGAVQVFPLTQQYGFPNPQQQGYPMPSSFKPAKPQPSDNKNYDAKF